MNKEKLKKRFFSALLLLSFVPLILLIIFSIFESIEGVTTFGSPEEYGLEAFHTAMFFRGLYYCVIVPVFPECLIYQVLYAANGIMKKFKLSQKVRTIVSVCLALPMIGITVLLMIMFR